MILLYQNIYNDKQVAKICILVQQACLCGYSRTIIIACYSSFIYFLIYVANLFVGAERVSNPMWQLLYVGISTGGDCSLLMASTSSFFYCMSTSYLKRPCKCVISMQHAYSAYSTDQISYYIYGMWILLNGISFMNQWVFSI